MVFGGVKWFCSDFSWFGVLTCFKLRLLFGSLLGMKGFLCLKVFWTFTRVGLT